MDKNKVFSTQMAFCAMSTLVVTILCDIITLFITDIIVEMFVEMGSGLVLAIICVWFLSKHGKAFVVRHGNQSDKISDVADIGTFCSILILIVEKMGLNFISKGYATPGTYGYVVLLFVATIIIFIASIVSVFRNKRDDK